MYITENGFSDCGSLDDELRIQYVRNYTDEVLKGISFLDATLAVLNLVHLYFHVYIYIIQIQSIFSYIVNYDFGYFGSE